MWFTFWVSVAMFSLKVSDIFTLFWVVFVVWLFFIGYWKFRAELMLMKTKRIIVRNLVIIVF